MDFKKLWLIFITAALVITPTKIYGIFTESEFMKSATFDIAALIILGILILLASLLKLNQKNIDVNKNYFLGIISLGISFQFFRCISAYFNDTSKYDFAWQPFMMSFFSILSCISFILIAITFFTGKNIINKASFFLYCPILWFGLYMLIFMSIYTNNVNQYEVISAALISLFLVYHTQIFSTSSKLNIIKLLFVFGMPSIIFSLITCIPTIIKIMNNQAVGAVSSATSCLHLFLSVYILFTLIDAHIQYDKNNDPVIKSVSIK